MTSELFIYDTLKREKRAFVPRDPERVTLYVCGPTVYSFAHIGNARPVVVFDVLFRLLRHIYGEDQVVYARNITDVDDKINKKAMDEGVEIGVITERFAAIYEQDMATLGALSPTLTPRVTQNMAAIIKQIQDIIDNGHAYEAEGHVLFDVLSFEKYGALSGRSVDDMIMGARVEVAPYKKNPQDFVLWKPSKPGEPLWQSPWGEGRPGWHIECSAMIEANLGLPIDIHGGGHDLIFPHHENEIAQGICAQHDHGHDQNPEYARYWMHNGFLDFSGEKMSKSLGNVVLVNDLTKKYPGEVIRWALLSATYRNPLEWNASVLEQSRNVIDRIYGILRASTNLPMSVEPRGDRAEKELLEPLLDDLSTPFAQFRLSHYAKALSGYLNSGNEALASSSKRDLLDLGALMGFFQQDPEVWFKAGADDELTAKVEALLAARKTARAEKNWAEADRIRDELNALNIEVMDSATGVSWKIKSTIGE